MSPSASLVDRLRALTPLQRALLVRRLEEEAPARAASQLRAYVVPRADASLGADDIQDSLRTRLPEYMVPTVVVMLDELPRTPSGKVDRRALPAPEPAGPVGAGGRTSPPTHVEQHLLDIWADVLRMDRIDVEDNFFEIGGDSIASIQIISRANRAGLQIKPSQFFDYPTIAALARVATTVQEDEAPQAAAAGPVPMTPIQRWFFEQALPDPHHWNQVLSLHVAPAADSDQLEAALRATVSAHEAFRLRYHKGTDGWAQTLVEDASSALQVVRHTLDEGEAERALAEIQAASQEALDLATGPLLRADLVDRGDGAPGCLILTAHHLVIDVLSWPALLGDLEAAYLQLLDGQAPQVRASGAPFSQWANALADLAESDALADERTYWLEQAQKSAAPLPTDASGANTERTAQTLTRQLDAAATQALTEATATYGLKVPEMVLAALAVALADWTGSPTVRIDLEGHGREDLDELPDVSQAVGWFTSLYPVTLVPASASPRDVLIHVKEALRGVPRKGLGYGVLRYLSEATIRGPLAGADRQFEVAPTEVLFNYMGQATPHVDAGSPLRGPVELTGSRGPDGTRAHLIEINAQVDDGALTLRWTYSTALHRVETIERLARETESVLQVLVEHCLASEAGGYTPSDFPDVDLNQDDLDALLGDFE